MGVVSYLCVSEREVLMARMGFGVDSVVIVGCIVMGGNLPFSAAREAQMWKARREAVIPSKQRFMSDVPLCVKLFVVCHLYILGGLVLLKRRKLRLGDGRELFGMRSFDWRREP